MESNDGFQACEGVHRRVPHAGTLAASYMRHRSQLHETVLRKVSADACHPVALRARDLQAPLAGLVRNPGLDEPSAGAWGWASP